MSPYMLPESPPTTSCDDQSSTDANAYDGLHKSHVHHSHSPGSYIEPIAVIGLSLEFPQEATSSESFWQMLVEARSGRTKIPKDRFNLEAFHHADASRQDNFNIREGHFLKKDLGSFDAPFFSITPAEAACMDPQQRGLLETAYRALENAGIRLEDAAGSKTSVHVGSFAHDWQDLIKKDSLWRGSYEATGSESTFLANRVSWFFDLVGPSVSLDTACSSSLMALHLACQSLRSRESSMGLVGGANVFFSPDNMTSMANLGMLSSDGICYSFDHRANGYARGEGYGFVVIKRLSDALKAGDTIRTIIRATGSNQDGKTLKGITQPNGDAQERLIRDTYESASLERKLTRYFEAHGTGTPTGDPIEARAIAMAFDGERSEGDPLYIGSVKTNIGHLEGASGIASLIKTILVLEKGKIPPNIWFEKTNPRISERDWNIRFPRTITRWPGSGLRRASVNSFGLGGSNVHVVLDDVLNYLRSQGIDGNHLTVDLSCCTRDVLECRQPSKAHGNLVNGCGQALQPKVYVWSAADEDGLRRLAQAYASQLYSLSASHVPNTYLENLSYTLFAKRSLLRWRSYVVASSLPELCQALEQGAARSSRSTNSRKLAFIFTGQGAQWHAMGRELMEFPVYRTSLRESQLAFSEMGCRWSLSDELARGEDVTKIHDPEYSQPICTALQIALIDFLESCGQSPSAVLGHSSGEIAAAYCAGALSKRSALQVAFYRGCLAAKLTKAQRQGAMMSVGLSESASKRYISTSSTDHSDYASIACINSPKNVTLSGTERQINTLQALFEREGVAAKVLRVNVAYHSKAMDEIAVEYGDLISDLTTGGHKPQRPVIVSSLTGTETTPDEMSKGTYWVRNLTSPVRFSEALTRLCLLGTSTTSRHNPTITDILEIGPHSTLKWPIRDTLTALEHGKTISYDSLLVRGASALTSSFSAIGRLHCLGYAVNLSALNNPIQGKENPHVLADLPEYPFNHSQSYWFESRLSKNSRFRTHARHELLGTRVPDWNPKEAKWRHMIRGSENPWITDHKVNGIELYPAGGLLVMAIEAARQMSNTSKSLTGYRLTDIYFVKPLMSTSKSEGFETQISLRHIPYEDNRASESKAFAVYTHEDGDWIENCRGTITLEYFDAELEFNYAKESEWELERTQQTFNRGSDCCKTAIDSLQLYRRLEGIGLSYGPKFRVLHCIRHGDDEAIATVNLRQWATDADQGHYEQHVIHPTALDGLIQLSLPALFERDGKRLTTMVPKYVRSVWVSQCLSTTQNAAVKAHAQHIRSYQGASECNILALDPIMDKAQVVIKGLQTAKLGIHTAGSQFSRKRICYGFDWKPSLDLLDNEGLLQYCSRPLLEPPDDFIEDLEFMCFSFMSSTLEILAGRDTNNLKPHFHRYIGWMQHQRERYSRGELVHWRPEWPALRQDTHYVDKVISRVEAFSAEGELYAKIGLNLLDIIEGKVDALDLLFAGDLATRFYQEANGTYQGLQTIKPFLDALAHKTPGLKILEIGAGTGSSTGLLLEAFSPAENAAFGSLRYEKYMFTDISSGFFEKAKQRFKNHADRMTYATLDIEQDPLQQGFQDGEYDLVFAANVLHATSNIEATLRNTRKLLKSGGKLILSEVFNDAVTRVGFAFGLLPGWWLGTEENRQGGPLLPEADWNTALRVSGFSGTDLVVRDWEDPRNHMTNTMISTAISQAQTWYTSEVVIVLAEESNLQSATADKVKDHLACMGVSCHFQDFSKLEPLDLEKRFCVFLPEMESSLLKDPSETDYARIKCLFHSPVGLLWVTQGGGYAPTRPETGMIVGLSRCVRSEDIEKTIVTLALDNSCDVLAIAQYVAKIIEDRFRTWPEKDENEYQERDGKLYINRLVEGIELNDHIFSKTSPQEARKENLNYEERNLTLKITSPGALNTLQYVEDPEIGEPMMEDEIEVKVQAVGLNLSDALVALGRLPESELGVECAGVVTRAGYNAGFVPGDRVCVLALGTFKTCVRSRAMTACKIPGRMSFCEAAAFPLAFVTAFHALCEIANLVEGESILIHSGADAVGQAAIQLSQHLRAEIFVTVGSEEEKRVIMTLYAIQENRIFSSQGLLFSSGTQRITGNRGVDVILNTLADEGLRRSWDCLAPFGSFIDIRKNNSTLSMLASRENCRYAALNVLHMVIERPRLIKKTMESVMALLEDKNLSTPQPLRIYNNSRLEEAFRSLQNGESTGKSVVEFSKEDLVTVVPNPRPTYKFQADKTYLISGGLGGLGRQIVRWMALQGARHFILLSRSGARSKEARELLYEMQKMSVKIIAASCDVSDEVALASALVDAAQRMPPIKGCIQASMVLEDSLFESMTLSAFTTATKPKVHGSWNLHKLLPKGMDFFVLLSSASGIVGFRAQANYAAGNTYQDTLARYRTSQGEKAVSLNLGTIASSGYVAERPEIMDAMMKMGYPPIDEAELLALLDFYCDPRLGVLDQSRCQVVTGLSTPAKMRQMGMEEAYWMRDNRFRALWQMDRGSHAVSLDTAESTTDYKTLLSSAGSPVEAAAIVSSALLKKLAETLSMPLEDLDAGQPMHAFGVDSLVAVEIRNWLGRDLGVQLSVFEILGKDSITDLSAGVAKRYVKAEEV